MSWLEEELKSTVKRRMPPAGFAERVVARAEAGSSPSRSQPVWRWVGSLAACLTLFVGTYAWREELKQREAARVQAELGLALGITAEKLEFVRVRLDRIGRKGEL